MTSTVNASADERLVLDAAIALARRCEFEEGHSRQVTRLALRLFDELSGLHRLGGPERFWLQCAGLLHDIGWIEGQKAHHKTAMRMILDAADLPLDRRSRRLVALVARYHRRALPRMGHKGYGGLDAADRRIVSRLAGMLRVADGLDVEHANIVQDVSCQVSPHRVVVRCQVASDAEAEVLAAARKGDLFERVFRRELAFELVPPGEPKRTGCNGRRGSSHKY